MLNRNIVFSYSTGFHPMLQFLNHLARRTLGSNYSWVPHAATVSGILLKAKASETLLQKGEGQHKGGSLYLWLLDMGYSYWLLIRLNSGTSILCRRELYLKEILPINTAPTDTFLRPKIHGYLLPSVSLYPLYA